ncbi:RRM domain-containing protein [Mycena chlorophos]|uniref:RRM domain-containing protein n=1 Tax=Mycena chlorophos TaxID=658473 RepID=A0A8H6WLH9_MYCCL|nr:RRM domain-containing protein [Mycena chlorophos]
MTNSPAPLSGPVFKFSRETNAVRVENIPATVNRLEILSLFRTLIGEIRSSQDLDDALEITFFTGDNARKALCMSGYNVDGSSLVVTPIVRSASPALSQNGQGKRNDTRRNLYVLGIPFGMTNQALADLFGAYGTVSHCVILATLDGASRRRGFVVMSSHEEARRAMTALGRTGKTSGGLDISWAVVQRSKGFLDGGDRAGVVQPPASTLKSPSPVPQKPLHVDGQSLPALSTCATAMVLLANLPSLLFNDENDLRGLACPFGNVKAMRMLKSSDLTLAGSGLAAGTTAAVVHYTTMAAAQDARRCLEGQSYAECIIRVAYLVDPDVRALSDALFDSPPILPSPRLPATFAASRCSPAVAKPVFNGRNVCNFATNDVGYQWEQLQLPVHSVPSFVQYDTFPNDMATRWFPMSVYGRAPSRDLGYCV